MQSQGISDSRECRVHFEDTPEIVLFLSEEDTTEEIPEVVEEDWRDQGYHQLPMTCAPEVWRTLVQTLGHDKVDFQRRQVSEVADSVFVLLSLSPTSARELKSCIQMALRSLKCLFAGLAALAVVGEADTPSAEDAIADDECVDGVEGACALSALQRRSWELRGEPMQGDDANVVWGQEADESAAPALTAWLESMRPEDLLGESPEALGSPPANDSDSDLGSAADSRWAPPSSQRSLLKVNRRGGLEPPSSATQYNGVAWEDMVIPGTGEMHVFTIGDWGGLLWEQFSDGGTGLHVYPFIRSACGILDMKNCFNETGDSAPDSCKQTCGYVAGVDDHAQVVVAEQMKKRAEKTGVHYILNVGDNFYPQALTPKPSRAACKGEVEWLSCACDLAAVGRVIDVTDVGSLSQLELDVHVALSG
eukprot:s1014_g7.t1